MIARRSPLTAKARSFFCSQNRLSLWVGVYQVDLRPWNLPSRNVSPTASEKPAGSEKPSVSDKKVPANEPAGRFQKFQAKRIGSLAIPMITAADIDPHSNDLILTNYYQAFVYPAIEGSSDMAERFKQSPRNIPLPPLKQIEAWCDRTRSIPLDNQRRVADDHGAVSPFSQNSSPPFFP